MITHILYYLYNRLVNKKVSVKYDDRNQKKVINFGMPEKSEATSHLAASRLGNQPVGKLLLKFSIPAITGMLLNALYNVVDRIFIGHAVNETALGGISLVLPLMTIGMAFAMLFGIGAANMISMRLGQNRRQDAENALIIVSFY